MSRRRLRAGGAAGAARPGSCAGRRHDGFTPVHLGNEKNADLAQQIAINSIWVLVAGILVMFMQAGFAFLEIGFSRGKNVGTVVAKILVNFSIAAICFWAARLRSPSARATRSSAPAGSSSTA